jgi:competence ComEA-like helix-hairpin-helix protein
MRKTNYSRTYISPNRVILVLTLCLFVFGCARKQIEAPATPEPPPVAQDAININTAGVEELAKIPYIGDKLAVKIVEHREKFGPFRRPEHLMLIEGISERKFLLVRALLKTE